ncbi:hypothetical protein MLD52_20555 [Puniceicoccaceae bacterium K14]|nr:hypothetical protein [Puniceicoccaceae bacterium K14]
MLIPSGCYSMLLASFSVCRVRFSLVYAFVCCSLLLSFDLQAQNERDVARDVRSFVDRTEKEREEFRAIYGKAAEPALELINGIQKSKGKNQRKLDRKYIQISIDKLEKLDTKKMELEERSKVGKAWWKAAELTRRLDGPTEEMMEQLEMAYSLAPDDEELMKEVAYQRRRVQVVSLRLAEAKRVREAREAGKDPYANLKPLLSDRGQGGAVEKEGGVE